MALLVLLAPYVRIIAGAGLIGLHAMCGGDLRKHPRRSLHQVTQEELANNCRIRLSKMAAKGS